jgi:pyruvate-formate lyase-activating enzyme
MPPEEDCRLVAQGFRQGACLVGTPGGRLPACRAALRDERGSPTRLIRSIHLSRPENYLSIYQSGCNMTCRKCHSWEFSREAEGEWMTPEMICEQAEGYDARVTLREPREKATAWHAHDTCRCCGSCVLRGENPASCPGILYPDRIVYSPQGFGPARNIAAFTGGDLACRPEFYGECSRLIKSRTRLRVLVETNGFGLTPRNLDFLLDSGVDSFWLDIKAHDPGKHRWLTGCSNENILQLPEEMTRRGFVLEVLSLYIPGLVEGDELERIAGLLARTDPAIPFTILAFFPEYRMMNHRSPTVEEMAGAWEGVRAAGLTRVRLGNLGVFARTGEDREYLASRVDGDAL